MSRESGNTEFAHVPSNLTVIFKGSDRCNAGCHFCSVGDPEGKIIEREDVVIVVSRLAEYLTAEGIRSLTFTFHGGEPTLLGAELIRFICERVSALPVKVTFRMQSNLIHMPDAVRKLVEEYHIKVGTSIDPIGGDRVDAQGNDAFPTWLAGYLKMARNGAIPGGIYVVTRSGLGRAAEVYRIAQAIGAATGDRFGIQINPVYAQGRAADGERRLLLTPEEFGHFLVDIWRIWEENDRDISLTPISMFAECFPMPLTPTRRLPCTFNGICSRDHVGINYNLEVAGCGRRLDSRNFVGNLKEATLLEILSASPEKKIVDERAARLRDTECLDCRFFVICHGGCHDDAELAHGDVSHRFPWCESYRMLFGEMEKAYSSREQAQRPFRNVGFDTRTSVPLSMLATTDPKTAPDWAQGQKNRITWILPTQAGEVLRFGSGLAELQGRTRGAVLLWLPNRQVRSMPMWEKYLRQPKTSVGLYEADGLAEASNVLNALHARIHLDIPSILAQEGGVTQLKALLDRFLFDGKWKSQIHPFSRMVTNLSRRRPIQYLDCFGAFPTRVHLNWHDDAASTVLPENFIERMKTESDILLEQWLIARRPCLSCRFLMACGGSVALGDQNPCSPDAMALVETISDTLKDLAAKLAGPAGSSGA